MFPGGSSRFGRKQTEDESESQHFELSGSNPMDSIVVTRMHTGRSTPLSPHILPSHPSPQHLPSSLPPLPAPARPMLVPTKPSSSRPPDLKLVNPNLDEEASPQLRTTVAGKWLHIPRTPSTPSPRMSGPWHGRSDSPHTDSTPVRPLSPYEEKSSFGEHQEQRSKPNVSSPLQRRHTYSKISSENTEDASQKFSPPLSPRSDDSVHGLKCLEEAVCFGEPNAVAIFLKRGHNPDGDGVKVPLALAAAGGKEKIVKLLLTAGADIDRQDSNKCTALHYAASGGHRGVVKLLLVAGADMFTRNEEGLLPVELASDSRLHQLLACRMRSDHNSPTSQGTSLNDRENFREELDLNSSISSCGSELESPHYKSMPASPIGRHDPLKKDKGFPEISAEAQQQDQQQKNSEEEKTEEVVKRSVKFVPQCSEEDLAHIRKDWHDAARSGCVGCGKEGCAGKCLPQKQTVEKEKPNVHAPSTETHEKLHCHSEDKKSEAFQWTRGELLGEGAYGKVFAGLNQSTGELMAVKQLKINPTDGQEKSLYLASLQREIALYKKLRHKHIVGYINMEQDLEAGSLFIFLEYVPGGSIQSMLERFGRFSEPLVRVYTRQLLLGLEYLHGNKIVHRDIKGGNVLVDADGVVKLADFGASKAFHDPMMTDGCKSIRGSVFWMAPEVIKGDGYGRRADIWSVGCTVIEMLTANHPWPGIDNTWTAIFHIAKASSGPPIPEDASDCSKDFIQQCFQLDAKLRPTASQLLEHPFVAPNVGL